MEGTFKTVRPEISPDGKITSYYLVNRNARYKSFE
jgi:hypothetical protein